MKAIRPGTENREPRPDEYQDLNREPCPDEYQDLSLLYIPIAL
jgi:hypothetical protein